MNYKNQSTPKKNKTISYWVKSTPPWKFMSNLKLALKRMSLSASYWDWSHIFQIFRYFMPMESADARQIFLTSFRFKGIEFDLRPME